MEHLGDLNNHIVVDDDNVVLPHTPSETTDDADKPPLKPNQGFFYFCIA